MSKPKSAASLLIVDDDLGLLRLASKTLGREGYTVATAGTAAEAMDWLEKNQPDLLLLDLKLRETTAQKVIAELTASKRLRPFLIITGQGDESVAVEMMKSGALDYLVKNKDFLDFLPTVTRRALKGIEKEKKLAAAEEALRLSEMRFRVALKNSPIMVFNQDADLRYTWVHNLPSGWKESDFLDKTDAQVFPPEEADRWVQLKTRTLLTGNGSRAEAACTWEGKKRYFDLTIEPVTENGRIAGITGAALEITERKRLEQEVLQISDMEQRRLGQDLHDGICQYLAGIELKSQALEQNLEKVAPAQAVQAGQIGQHVRDAIVQTRSLARSLSPYIVETEGLESGLQELAVSAGKLFNVKCQFVSESPVALNDKAVAAHLYRIAQEAVSNAVKHGRAKEIEIRWSSEAEQAVLSVTDNGQGFKPNVKPAGMGLRIMQYRANIIGGTLLIQNRQTGGVTVVCIIPTPGK
jgi:PAS domain S-box-containing protein